MSAYVVDDVVINRVVSWVNKIAMAGGSNDYFWAIRPLIELGYICDNEAGCNRLAEEMFTLNCDSVEQRYGPGQAQEFRPLDFQYHFLGFGTSIYVVLKSLRCFLYQCCEGNIPGQNALYEALEKVSMYICYHLVTRTPEYEHAKGW